MPSIYVPVLHLSIHGPNISNMKTLKSYTTRLTLQQIRYLQKRRGDAARKLRSLIDGAIRAERIAAERKRGKGAKRGRPPHLSRSARRRAIRMLPVFRLSSTDPPRRAGHDPTQRHSATRRRTRFELEGCPRDSLRRRLFARFRARLQAVAGGQLMSCKNCGLPVFWVTMQSKIGRAHV